MEHSKLIAHLDDQGCFVDENGKFENGCWYKNCVNANICLVTNEKEVSIPTCCHIFHELKIDPPFELESDYEIYKLFRKAHDGGKEMEAQHVLIHGKKPE